MAAVTAQPVITSGFPAEKADDRGSVDHREYDATVDVFDDPDDPEPDPNSPVVFKFSWRKLWKFAGPGWLMSLAYLDPGNLEGDLQQGAYTNLRLTWVLWWATVMGLVLQEMSARLGLVTGYDLAQTVRAHYPRWLCYTIYVEMELAVIGADIQEVVGTGVAFNLLSNGAIPVWAGCLITAADTFTFLAVQYFGVRYLEAFICILISTMSICFFINWGSANTDVGGLFFGWVVPTAQSYAVTQAVGTIGAVIMPHNLYLHSGLVLSRKINRESPHRVNEAIWYARIESAGALLFSFFINLAVVAVNADRFYAEECASAANGPYACLDVYTFNKSGDSSVANTGGHGDACIVERSGATGICGEIGLAAEGYGLGVALGTPYLYIWAIGLFAAGQAATMVCTYAGQIIMGGCLEIQIAPWKRVAFTRVFALGPALAVAAGTVGNPVLFNNINEYLNILQSVQLPFAMLPVLHFTASKQILGRFRSGTFAMTTAVLLALLVIAVNIVLVVQFLQAVPVAVVVIACIYAIFYFFACIRMVYEDLLAVSRWAMAILTCQKPGGDEGTTLAVTGGRDTNEI